jgi:hypothetical protein
VPTAFTSPADAIRTVAHWYRRDRTEGQPVLSVIIAEKATLVALLSAWFGEPYGIPVMALRGYQSESYEREVAAWLDHRGHHNYAAIYVGDLDPTGEDIERNAERYLGERFASWERVGVTYEQIDGLAINPRPGKESDSRKNAFIAKYGRLIQVEVEALDPNVLHELIRAKVDEHWDATHSEAVQEQEQAEREQLEALAEGLGDGVSR